jgi:hypothetical protein
MAALSSSKRSMGRQRKVAWTRRLARTSHSSSCSLKSAEFEGLRHEIAEI